MSGFNVPLPEFDAAQKRDLEWAIWNRGDRSFSLPRRIAIRNCGYVPPPDKPAAKPIEEPKQLYATTIVTAERPSTIPVLDANGTPIPQIGVAMVIDAREFLTVSPEEYSIRYGTPALFALRHSIKSHGFVATTDATTESN